MHQQNDFITLFNTLWYRDFPVLWGRRDFAKRADWTTHIATTVRQVAGLLGMIPCFESGGRSDAELRTGAGHVWAKMEWEWDEPWLESVGELHKLASTVAACETSVFIGYCNKLHVERSLEKAKQAWEGIDKPLVLILVTFEADGEWRYFERLQTYTIESDVLEFVRDQPALPWDVEGSIWHQPSTT